MFNRDACKLRSITEGDLDLVLGWRNSERIRANMYTDHVISHEEHKAWFERIKKEEPRLFLIFEYAGQPLGCVSLTRFDRNNGTCHWGFYVGEEAAPKGTGTVMACLAFEYAFDTLQIRKLIGEALAFNQASIAYHQKLGFLQEGRFVRHVLKGGKYEDVLSFALFREDWERLKERLIKKCFGRGE